MQPKCPNCGRTVDQKVERRHRPFCSERCQLVDLGRWLDEEYVVPGDPVDLAEVHELDDRLEGRRD